VARTKTKCGLVRNLIRNVGKRAGGNADVNGTGRNADQLKAGINRIEKRVLETDTLDTGNVNDMPEGACDVLETATGNEKGG
jgi:hypothetical protein